MRGEFDASRGDPCSGPATAAGRPKADAVVVDSCERAGRRLVGSVAARLVGAGRRPVTVVP
ncbi:hypothetical protein [Streptomyces sp.]|uniref:hypothetical protein n=1 Tax=Streptomyces sp. TaxID=1931 RepID=UPI002F3FADA1